jgi:hypothetical protein
MADVRVDDRDLRLVIGALTDLLEDGDFDLTENERKAYVRLCAMTGRKPAAHRPYEQQSLGLLADDDPLPPTGRGVMGDYIDRTRHFLRGGEGLPWPSHRDPPPPDVAKEIADKMARASKDAVEGRTPPPKPTEKRALTDEEKEAVRRALEGDEE